MQLPQVKSFCAAVALACLVCALPIVGAAQPGRGARKTTPPARRQEPFALREAADRLTLETSDYSVTISRAGFGLEVRRGGELVLQSAGPDDAATNLGFVRAGAPHRVTKLVSFARDGGRLTLDYETTLAGATARVELRPEPGAVRVTTSLLNNDADLAPTLRFRLAPSGFWYGGGFQGWRDPQVIPLNEARVEKTAFFAQGATQGTPVWYTTKGVAVWVRTRQDFRYSINRAVGGKPDGLLTIEMPGVSALAYDIIVARDVREVVRQLVREVGYPRTVPPADYFRLPIYTTWVEHKVPVTQAKVLEFARAIRKNKLPCGVVEIDDKWEDKYGDLKFDARKFPDPRAMVAELHRLGFRVTLWVHPFVNTDSETYARHRADGLLLRNRSGEAGLVKWWNGVAAVWDFTDPRAAAEFRARLARLQRLYGIDGFKFDGGDVNLVPQDMRAAESIGPAEYADRYNREATAHFAWNETRVGIYSQPLGVVQRLIDKHSTWGRENGLAAIIPEAITVSMRGFPYVMPDMIGGNQYDQDRVEKELLIRWAQASALMPLMQFSVGPWHFDAETIRLSREASELHLKFAPYIVRLAAAAPRTGEPILAPLWYHNPGDRETYTITDQFMLGEDVVVAPVLSKGATRRDLYLPAGRWRDDKTGQEYEGGRWLRDYPAPLDTLPVFVRVGANVI